LRRTRQSGSRSRTSLVPELCSDTLPRAALRPGWQQASLEGNLPGVNTGRSEGYSPRTRRRGRLSASELSRNVSSRGHGRPSGSELSPHESSRRDSPTIPSGTFGSRKFKLRWSTIFTGICVSRSALTGAVDMTWLPASVDSCRFAPPTHRRLGQLLRTCPHDHSPDDELWKGRKKRRRGRKGEDGRLSGGFFPQSGRFGGDGRSSLDFLPYSGRSRGDGVVSVKLVSQPEPPIRSMLMESFSNAARRPEPDTPTIVLLGSLRVRG